MPNMVLMRRAMVTAGARMDARGLIVAAEGNLSVRLGGHSFLVTPSGVEKGKMLTRDLLEVGGSGKSVLGSVTSEWPLHSRIYQERPDVLAICHAHPPWATAFSVAGRDLDGNILTETTEMLPHVPLAVRAAPGTKAMAESVASIIRNHDAILLGNHGAVTVGKSLEEALQLMETVERLAQVTLLSEIAAGSSRLDPGIIRNLTQSSPR